MSKLYLEKPQSSQLVQGANTSLNPDLECCYYKDTGHLKERCIKLNHRLVQEQQMLDKNSSALNVHSTSLAN